MVQEKKLKAVGGSTSEGRDVILIPAIARPPANYRDDFGGPRRSIPKRHRTAILDILTERQGPVRWQDFKDAGVDYNALRDMVREGSVLYPAVGVFTLRRRYELLTLALASLSAHGTEFFACLTTAAQYHGLMSNSGNYLWVMLPANRNTLRDIVGYEPVPVRWNAMRIPSEGLLVTDEMRADVGWTPDMPVQEVIERYYGIYRETIYGNSVKVTSPARTICDLLMFRNRPIGREGLNGLSIDERDVFDAVLTYQEHHNTDDALAMAERMQYGREVIDHLNFAARINTLPAR